MFRLATRRSPYFQTLSNRSRTNIISFNSRRFISDGTSGQSTWSLPTSFISSYAHESKKLLGWAVAFLTLLIIWPASIVGFFNAVDKVPSNTGSQVQLNRVGGGGGWLFGKYDAKVDIPNINVKLDSSGEDDD